MTDLFKPSTDDQSNEEIKSYKEHLVGEGKKFKDEEALARAKWESDLFIKKVTSENEEMRKELATRMTLEEFWEKTQASQTKTKEDSGDTRREEPAAQANAPKTEEIMDLVRKTLNEEVSKSQKTRNVEMVREELTKTWGPNFSDRLNIRARELGSTPEFLGTMAESQPKAFLALMLGKTERSSDSNEYIPPRTQFSPSASSSSKRNNEYYSKMRRENPTQYWKPSTQNEMFKAAKELGEAFYKS